MTGSALWIRIFCLALSELDFFTITLKLLSLAGSGGSKREVVLLVRWQGALVGADVHLGVVEASVSVEREGWVECCS